MKNKISELAIFGGSPTFNEKLHVGRPNIGSREILLQRINDILDSKWLSNNGNFVQEFEHQIASLVGAKHCIATCNATIGLEIAIKACELKGEVIVPSFTFVATAHALQWQGIEPVFCDIDPKTHNIDPKKIESLITDKTTAIIGVHLWGRGCDVEALAEIAKRYNLKLLFDAAHAFSCSYQGQMIGNFGNVEVFSFNATKFCNSFEGGAIVTNDSELANKIRLMKNFGFSNYDCVDFIGINGKMSEVSAAMGLTSLESINDFININRRNYQKYQQELSNIRGINLINYDDAEQCNYQYVIIEIDESITGISRDKIYDILWAENVLARRYFYPGCHQMEPYRSRIADMGLMLTNTRHLAARVLALPTGTAIGISEISNICQILRLVSTGENINNEMLYRNVYAC
ncbi:putative PLP-dependent enzyme possibly involved in cell wall biogenesis [Rivularia sp. PCC 7116]|uniref:aminotransferase class I/II-fold pyridoxal phosphate-dependent enzyme n=1 Tax=Rivularia sp. PCC 7116 TaxID=373994 RepID=UPI00029EE46C|nr:aminotransferase class I/II-fold pyridoxal phosphate-dependent enzyme [Rivularia sp. PCC 7116]AFY53896.1 putative PLP-dependent enzyme possibly involved in cell wall biogenesis [Rivularia sp. PCC 7116]